MWRSVVSHLAAADRDPVCRDYPERVSGARAGVRSGTVVDAKPASSSLHRTAVVVGGGVLCDGDRSVGREIYEALPTGRRGSVSHRATSDARWRSPMWPGLMARRISLLRQQTNLARRLCTLPTLLVTR